MKAAKIFISTFGCSLNQADGQAMSAMIENAGFSLVDTAADADLIIINSCSVKDKTILNFRKTLRKIPKKPTIITGCIPEAEPNRDDLKELSLVGTEHISDIVDVIKKTLLGKRIVLLGKNDEDRVSFEQKRTNPYIEIVPISKGCIGNCAYCQTKLARRDLVSYSKEKILKRISNAVKDGVNQIWLTSQDCSVYGLDIGNDNIFSLLRDAVALPGDFILRLGMSNPKHLHENLKELVGIFDSKKLYKFIHIPIQSGSNNVLKIMRRKYTVKTFEEIVAAFRKKHPDITIATDIIIGHPGETDEDFQKTISLIKKLKLDVVNISKYSPRPGTDSAKMEQIEKSIIQHRMKSLKSTLKEILENNNSKYVGWKGDVIVESQKRKGSAVCRNFAYRPVIIPIDILLDQKLHIEVVGYTTYHLKGRILK
jgi:threonylcarbamoyladenosine tRNA methylthiotransferase CDKAL1